MANQVSQPLIQQSNGNAFINLWNLLVQPADELTGDDRRRAISVASLTLTFIPLGLITILIPAVLEALNGREFIINIGGIIGMTIVVASYTLSRTKHFQIGAYLVIAVPFIAVSAASLSSEVGISESGLIFMSLSVILSSLLLTSRYTVFIGILAIVTIIMLFIVRPNDAITPVPIITYTLIAAGVMATISRIREQSLKDLELAQSQLKIQIQEAEEARDRAERSDQVKSSFLASMSHELRTPLNAIINFTRFVSKGTLGPVNEDQVETLENVTISGKHLLNLINDVLDMAKIDSGSLTLFVSDDVSLPEIITNVSVTGRALLNDKPVTIKTEMEETLPQIRGDHQRIRQILLNIISNACKFTDEGSITITAKQDNADVIISVTDTGCGIAESDQKMVFEAFMQTHDGLRQGGGTGLGMPITKNLIEAHGGTLELESELGRGSTFYIRLPIKSTTISPTLMTEI